MTPSPLRWPYARAIALSLLATAAGCGPHGDVTVAPAPRLPALDRPDPPPPPLESGRLPDTARPTHYGLSLVVDPTKDRFFGSVTIDVDVPKETSFIILHARDLTLARVEALVDGRPIAARTSSRMVHGGAESPEELVLSFARPIPAGSAQLRIDYSGALEQRLNGLYRVKEGDLAYVFTQLEPMDARRMFPCFDEPGFKVPFDLRVTTPRGNVVVANANESERTDSEDGRSVTFTFGTTPPLPTYLLALAVGPLEIRDGPDRPIKLRLITAKGKARLGDLALEAAAALVPLAEEYFDRPFPYPKLDLVAVPGFAYGAMENAGLVTFREDRLLIPPGAASLHARRGVAEIIAKQIAHHWFGDLVTMRWWDDRFLREGFATWMTPRLVDAWQPSMGSRLAALGAKSAVLESDAHDGARPVRQHVASASASASASEASEAFDPVMYEKTAIVIGSLEGWLGPDVLRAGVRSFIKAHEHKSASSADFFRALATASGKGVEPVVSSFLDQPGVPLVRASLVCDKGKAPRVTLSQSRYRIGPNAKKDRANAEARWSIPVCVAYEGAPGGAPSCGLLDAATSELLLGPPAANAGADGADTNTKNTKGPVRCPKWIYPNANEAGYYRFALPKAQLAALTASVMTLDPSSRIGLLGGAWALVMSGDMTADDFLDLLAGMKAERHPIVLEQIIESLARAHNALVDDDARPAFRAYAASILLPVAIELGWDAKKRDPPERSALRERVLAALAVLAESPWLAPEADRKAAAYLKDFRSVDPAIAVIAMTVSSRRAGEKRFSEIETALPRARTPQDRDILLRALGSFASPALLRRALDLMLSDKLRPQDGVPIVLAAMAWSESRPRVLAWLKERSGDLKGRLPGYILGRFSEVIATTCDRAAQADAAKLFREAAADTEGEGRRLSRATEAAGQCIELRAREGARAKARLAKGAR
jgi:alanyl aminopeptidase